MSAVITRPPLCSSVLPFSRTVIVITDSVVSKPLIVFFSPVFLTLKSTSRLFSGGGAASDFVSLPSSFFASSSAFLRASSIRRRISANVVTLYDFFLMSSS